MSKHGSPLARHWALDPDVIFLNHGSFGACPTAVLEAQAELRARLEREPVRFFERELESRLDSSRALLADFLACEPTDLVFVPNATTGVNAVLRSSTFTARDELLVTDHAYNACRNALDFVAARSGATVVVAHVPFPVAEPDAVTDAVLARVTDRTRLALIDHVASTTALAMPVETIVPALTGRGIDVLVDGAHAPGNLDLDVPALGATYYTGNCHKWLCAPKGAGFLWVTPERQADVRPLTISHGANATRTDRSRFQLEFDWTGTDDPTAALCVGTAIRCMAELMPAGWPGVRAHNRALARRGRDLLCEALGIEPPAPDGMLGCMASVPLPAGLGAASAKRSHLDPLQDALFFDHGIEVPVVKGPKESRRLLRISAQLYNEEKQYASLAAALRGC